MAPVPQQGVTSGMTALTQGNPLKNQALYVPTGKALWVTIWGQSGQNASKLSYCWSARRILLMPKKQNGFGSAKSFAVKGVKSDKGVSNSFKKGLKPMAAGVYPSNREYGHSYKRQSLKAMTLKVIGFVGVKDMNTMSKLRWKTSS